LQLTMCGGILNSMSSNQQEFHASILLPLPIIQYSLTIVTCQTSINAFQRLESVDLEMHGFSPSWRLSYFSFKTLHHSSLLPFLKPHVSFNKHARFMSLNRVRLSYNICIAPNKGSLNLFNLIIRQTWWILLVVIV
jgi:hypothetical protein